MTYRKAVYREYTDARFSTLKSRLPEREHLVLHFISTVTYF